MKKRLKVTIRIGFYTTRSESKDAVEYDIRKELAKYVPPEGKIDVDVREVREND